MVLKDIGNSKVLVKVTTLGVSKIEYFDAALMRMGIPFGRIQLVELGFNSWPQRTEGLMDGRKEYKLVQEGSCIILWRVAIGKGAI